MHLFGHRQAAFAYGLFLAVPSPLRAACTESTKGEVIILVHACQKIDPSQRFAKAESLPTWAANWDRESLGRLLATYRGALLTGTVKKSAAIKKGLVNSREALKGETVTVFSASPEISCQNVGAKTVQGMLEEQCCDGSGIAPCLLQQKYSLGNAKFVVMKDNATQVLSPTRKKAQEAFQKGDYYGAANLFGKSYQNRELDLLGKWQYAVALDKTESCANAIRPLKDLERAWLNGDTGASEDKFIGASQLLLARCYAKSANAADAVIILDRFLKSPARYQSEIKAGISHKDFLWIRNAPEYKMFVETAKLALKKL